MNEAELMEKLRHAFMGEARERLDSLTSHLDVLEKDADPVRRGDALEVAYREFHSLKGAARAVGFSDVESVCQAAESLLSALKREEVPLSREVIRVLSQVLNFVERIVQGEAGEESVSGLCRRLECMLHGAKERNPSTENDAGRNLPASVKECGSGDEKSPAVPVSTESAHTRRDALDASYGIIPVDVPDSLGAAAHGGSGSVPGWDVKDTRHRQPSSQPVSRSGQLVRVDVQRLDVFLKRAEELISAKLAMMEHLRLLKNLHRRYEQSKRLYSSGFEEFKALKSKAPDLSTPSLPPAGKDLMEVLQFVGNHQTALHELGGDMARALASAEETARTLAILVEELMEGAKDVLLQPFGLVLRGLSRMVRDIADQLGKDVSLIIEGDDVEADRRILEELKDPLVHLLRNAVDHGLETPSERLRLGKAPQGTIRIRVVQDEARTVTLTVEDDGRGIDAQALRETAVRRGILSAEEGRELSDEAVLQLIFRSDFSTSPMVTELSGRGLGMPIVKEKVEGLGGRVRVETQEGRGTRMILELPVSLATFRGILVGAGGRHFVVPTHAVEAVVKLREGDCQRVEGRETLVHGGRVIPLENLGRVLDLPEADTPSSKDTGRRRAALILTGGDRTAAVEVDSVLGEQEILIKGLGPQLQKVMHIWGATILGSGQVVPVLNAVEVVRSVEKSTPRSFSRTLPVAAGQIGAAADKRKRAVLVAEDSVTSRTLLKNILETAGYSVQTAVDGQEALALLREYTFDAVVSDVEMPRMNGFDLTRAIRQDEKLKHMPVVLVTSLDSREHREEGLEAGADAYIVKSAFDQSTLLDVLERFTG